MTAIFSSNLARRLLTAAGLAAILNCGVMAQTGATASRDAHPPKVLAHRGGALLRPENTLPAFRHAVEIGTDIIEFDMQMTADNQIVVHHDTAINPAFCTPDIGTEVKADDVHRLSLAGTQRFDCGRVARPSYAGPKFVAVPGAHIPTLGDMLRTMRDADVDFFAETKIAKGSDVDPVRFATLVEAAIRENGLEDRLILQSFDYRTIDALHRINPRIRTCLLGAQKLTSDYRAILREHRASCIVLKRSDVDAQGVARLQADGILVYSDVVDTAEEWRSYADLGFDAIFTNDPQGAIDFLRPSARRP
ncbi:MAG: hypothetical protein I8H86_00825 [Sphingomonadaceae bacterium]|nr:hypothetical protein [Sphingomonadaceae bacterium]MBH1999485.1 hypothetical protein [Sphingomonadaceae bacterium]